MKTDVNYTQAELVQLSKFNAVVTGLIYYFKPHEHLASVTIVWFQKDGHNTSGETSYDIGTVNSFLKNDRWLLVDQEVSDYSIF